MYIAPMTIINSVREVIHMPVSGVGNGAQPVMSFNYGAKRIWESETDNPLYGGHSSGLYIICVGNDDVISEPVCDNF